jgi:hypothetical protein
MSAWDSVAYAPGYSLHPVMAITGVSGNFFLIIEIRLMPLNWGIRRSVITRSNPCGWFSNNFYFLEIGKDWPEYIRRHLLLVFLVTGPCI